LKSVPGINIMENEGDGDDVFIRMNCSAYVNGVTLAAFQTWLKSIL